MGQKQVSHHPSAPGNSTVLCFTSFTEEKNPCSSSIKHSVRGKMENIEDLFMHGISIFLPYPLLVVFLLFHTFDFFQHMLSCLVLLARYLFIFICINNVILVNIYLGPEFKYFSLPLRWPSSLLTFLLIQLFKHAFTSQRRSNVIWRLKKSIWILTDVSPPFENSSSAAALYEALC